MIACILVPGFALRAALRKQPGLALRPAALAPVAGTEPLLGPVTAEAERLGVRPGMRLGEGLATCPELVLVEQDPAAAEQAWEEILRALEDSGFAVDPGGPGCVYFETRGVERVYGGLEPARLGPGERRQGRARARAPSSGRDRGGTRVSGGRRERADVAARVRCIARDRARAAGTGRPFRPEGRTLRTARRRRFVEALGDA